MKMQLGKGMPRGKLKQEVHDDCIVVGFLKQSIKNRNRALESNQHMVNKTTNDQYTWSKSSKSWAASFDIPETFFTNFRIVSWPNIGISRYLSICVSVSGYNKKHLAWNTFHSVPGYHYLPEHIEVSENCLPDAKFELVQHIDNKHWMKVESIFRKTFRKCILHRKIKHQVARMCNLTLVLTYVGITTCDASNLDIASDSGCTPST